MYFLIETGGRTIRTHVLYDGGGKGELKQGSSTAKRLISEKVLNIPGRVLNLKLWSLCKSNN